LRNEKKTACTGYAWSLTSLIVIFIVSNCLQGANINALTNPGFESSTSGNWAARGGTFARTTTQKYAGSYSGMSSNRTATWNGIKQSVLGKMNVGSTYILSGWARVSATSDTVKISVQRDDGSGTSYFNVATATCNNTGWTYLSGSFTLSVTGTLSILDVYFEGPASGVILYVDDANVYGPPPNPINPNATGQVNTSVRHQILEGFGAAGAWYDNTLVSLGNSQPAIYDVLFGQLGLDIYRLKNNYQIDTGYAGRAGTIVANATASLGHSPRIMISSWSPPAYLKSDSNTIGGTLKKNGSGNYMYTEFAQWWYDSLIDFTNHGVNAYYVNMQNEPDYLADWDTCKFNPVEDSSWAGYNLAFRAMYTKLNTMSNRPKLLAPEAVGLEASRAYLNVLNANETDKANIYGYAHHLYGDGNVDSPDGYIAKMASFAATYNDKPRLQTEFAKGTSVTLTFTDAMNLALLMHNSLTVESAASYIYWELFWTSPKGLVSISTSGYTINSVYYAFKHYSAFTDPDWQRLDANTNSSVLRISSYVSPDNNKLTTVIINPSDSNITTLHLSMGNFEITDGNVYRSSSTQNCVSLGAYQPSVPLSIPKKTITTIALNGTLIPTNCTEVQSFGYGLLSDINGDCVVNYKDLFVLSEYWLRTDCASNANCDDADLEPDGDVDFIDFSDFAEQWMRCNDPVDSNCTASW